MGREKNGDLTNLSMKSFMAPDRDLPTLQTSVTNFSCDNNPNTLSKERVFLLIKTSFLDQTKNP